MRISDWSSDVCSSDLDSRRDDVDGGLLGRASLHARRPADDLASGAEQDGVQRGFEDRRRCIVRDRDRKRPARPRNLDRSEEHTSELQSLMRISYAVFCLKKNTDLYGCKPLQNGRYATTETGNHKPRNTDKQSDHY